MCYVLCAKFLWEVAWPYFKIIFAPSQLALSVIQEGWGCDFNVASTIIDYLSFKLTYRFPRCLSGKESDCKAGDAGSIPELVRSPGEGNGNHSSGLLLPGKLHGQRSLTSYIVNGVVKVRHDLVTEQ